MLPKSEWVPNGQNELVERGAADTAKVMRSLPGYLAGISLTLCRHKPKYPLNGYLHAPAIGIFPNGALEHTHDRDVVGQGIANSDDHPSISDHLMAIQNRARPRSDDEWRERSKALLDGLGQLTDRSE